MMLVLGTTTVDLLSSGFERLPRLEGDEFTESSLVFCDDPLVVTLGGNGANSAYVLGRLGAEVALCSAIGQDAMGGLVESWLHAAGVDTSCLIRSTTQATPTTTMLIDAAVNRISFHYAGPSSTFGPSDLDKALLNRATSVLVTGYPLLRAWRPDGIASLLAHAQQRSTVTALDLGPAIDPPARLDEVRPLLSNVDFLLCNAYELRVCTGQESLNSGIRLLHEAGARCVIVKQGPNGALLAQAGQNIQAVLGYPAQVSFTVGAGDAFNAGLLHAFTAGADLPDAVQYAHATAALVVQSGRGVLGSPDATTVEAFLSDRID